MSRNKHVHLTSSEQYLWDFIKKNPHLAMKLNISELSERANVSNATVVRTMKKLGYSGYTDFKYNQRQSQTYPILKQTDDQIKRVIVQNEIEINNTISLLNATVIEDAIQLTKDAKRIFLFARGPSRLIAEDMQLKLMLIGKNTFYFSDPIIIEQVASRLKENDVGIFISLNGETEALVNAAKTLYKNEISKIVFTCKKKSSLAEKADELFLGYQTENHFFGKYEVKSRLPLLVLTRIFLDSYVIRTKLDF